MLCAKCSLLWNAVNAIWLWEQTLVSWQGETLVCTQKGEKANRGWKHWIEGDKLHLVSLEWFSYCRNAWQTSYVLELVFISIISPLYQLFFCYVSVIIFAGAVLWRCCLSSSVQEKAVVSTMMVTKKENNQAYVLSGIKMTIKVCVILGVTMVIYIVLKKFKFLTLIFFIHVMCLNLFCLFVCLSQLQILFASLLLISQHLTLF